MNENTTIAHGDPLAVTVFPVMVSLADLANED